jgi:septin family protein
MDTTNPIAHTAAIEDIHEQEHSFESALWKKKGKRFKIMVVGETGLGKTTCLRTIFHEHAEDIKEQMSKGEGIEQMSKGEAIEDTTKRLSGSSLEKSTKKIATFGPFNMASKSGNKMELFIVDTPGYMTFEGEQQNSSLVFEMVEEMIKKTHEEWYRQDEAIARKPVEERDDQRIHACLYFIAPHRMKVWYIFFSLPAPDLTPFLLHQQQIDITYMRHLHKAVNIIPVLAKADTLTTKEQVDQKLDVLRQITESNIKIFQPNDDHLTEAQKQASTGNDRTYPPYAVIGAAKDSVEVDGKQVRGREYPYGTAEVDNPNHCDGESQKRNLYLIF